MLLKELEESAMKPPKDVGSSTAISKYFPKNPPVPTFVKVFRSYPPAAYFPTLDFELQEKTDQIISEIQSLIRELSVSCKALNELNQTLVDRPVVKNTYLFDIGQAYEVLQPIPIILEEFEDEVIASFPEIELFSVAENESEAIEGLKNSINTLFNELTTSPKNTLGKLPLGWLRLLNRLVKKIE